MKIMLTTILLNCNSDFPKICAWFESSCFAAPILNSTVSTSCTAQLLNWDSEFLFLLKTKARMAASSLLSLLRFSIQVYFKPNLRQQRGNRNWRISSLVLQEKYFGINSEKSLHWHWYHLLTIVLLKTNCSRNCLSLPSKLFLHNIICLWVSQNVLSVSWNTSEFLLYKLSSMFPLDSAQKLTDASINLYSKLNVRLLLLAYYSHKQLSHILQQ